MPTVTGNVLEITGGSMHGRNIALEFALTGPNLRNSTVFTTQPVTVTPLLNGDFEVNLADTTAMKFTAWYVMRVRWLGPGYPLADFPEWSITVPPDGGQLKDLVTLTRPGGAGRENLTRVIMSLTRPPNLLLGQLWWKTDPDDPDNLNGLNTGEIYMGGS